MPDTELSNVATPDWSAAYTFAMAIPHVAYALAPGTVLMPRSRSSFTRRSCNVRWARSTRPLAGLLFAQIVSMFSSYIARPNCVTLLPVLLAAVFRNTLALSL
ncbi:hypothetical protein LMG24238_07209 [Paraburkholderia sediminicola]|uniref:Uncharacterized protein n=1 Tax=Paraburkholderia sediminicola TaxID=458836 RepID=A0A6J5CW90_9BURK|nr:hypothetical protein LMG24238_07209 [Paraburkholderia sediminicola]